MRKALEVFSVSQSTNTIQRFAPSLPAALGLGVDAVGNPRMTRKCFLPSRGSRASDRGATWAQVCARPLTDVTFDSAESPPVAPTDAQAPAPSRQQLRATPFPIISQVRTDQVSGAHSCPRSRRLGGGSCSCSCSKGQGTQAQSRDVTCLRAHTQLRAVLPRRGTEAQALSTNTPPLGDADKVTLSSSSSALVSSRG